MAYRMTATDLLGTAAGRLNRDKLIAATEIATSSTAAKRPKYGNRKVTDEAGRVHDSTKEFRRWQELELRAHAGDIRSLRRQVPYALVVNGVLIARYIADFVYEDGAQTVCEDVKSPPTRKLEAYRMKVRLMQAIHGIQIREV